MTDRTEIQDLTMAFAPLALVLGGLDFTCSAA
jgi:hypothetical protein